MELKLTILISWLFWTILDHHFQTVSAETRIKATAPLEDVEEGAILSVHCQVTEVEEGHEVTLYRIRDGQSVQRVSVDDILIQDEDRLFLATRQLTDGSTVYFLSVMGVTRSDQGTYRCEVFDPVEQKTVATSSVHIAVLYFPQNQNPICSHIKPLQIMEGNELVLNCTFPKGNPPVKLQWAGANSATDLKVTEHTTDTHVVSLLTLRPRLDDTGAVYICKAFSAIFPEETPTCHSEQITVTRNPLGSNPPHIPPTTALETVSDPTVRHPMDCSKLCSTSTIDSPIFKWIISTTIAGIIALTFFIIVIIFMWKYYHVQNTSHNLYVTARPQLAEQVYSELECKRSDNMTYMSLTKEDTRRLNQQFITKYCPNEQQQYEDKA